MSLMTFEVMHGLEEAAVQLVIRLLDARHFKDREKDEQVHVRRFHLIEEYQY